MTHDLVAIKQLDVTSIKSKARRLSIPTRKLSFSKATSALPFSANAARAAAERKKKQAYANMSEFSLTAGLDGGGSTVNAKYWGGYATDFIELKGDTDALRDAHVLLHGVASPPRFRMRSCVRDHERDAEWSVVRIQACARGRRARRSHVAARRSSDETTSDDDSENSTDEAKTPSLGHQQAHRARDVVADERAVKLEAWESQRAFLLALEASIGDED